MNSYNKGKCQSPVSVSTFEDNEGILGIRCRNSTLLGHLAVCFWVQEVISNSCFTLLVYCKVAYVILIKLVFVIGDKEC